MRRSALLASLTLTAATAAGAQTPPSDRGPDGAPPAAMTRADAVARAEQRFAEMDANRDGAVTKDEFNAYMEARWQRRAAQAAPAYPPTSTSAEGVPPPPPNGRKHGGEMMGGHMFDRLDVNHDGRITLEEARADAAERFDRMDANHDGTITPDERGTMGGINRPLHPMR